MAPGDMYKWSLLIFAKKSKFHDAGGPDTVVLPLVSKLVSQLRKCNKAPSKTQ